MSIIKQYLFVCISDKRTFKTFSKFNGGLPPQFIFNLGGINGITQVVTGAVLYVSNQFGRFSFGPAQFAIHNFTKLVNEFNILPLIISANVIGFSQSALIERFLYPLTVV